jgi:hypothetical protein
MSHNIFEIINCNIVALSEDLNLMHKKIDEIHAVLYPMELPNATGDTPEDEEKVSSDHDLI